MLPAYAELHCLTNFSFLRGASHPEELAARAAKLGYCALAVTDECSLAGVVRAHVAAKEHGIKLIVGAEFRIADGPKLVLLATDREAYGNLSQLITAARRRSRKGSYRIGWDDLDTGVPGCLVLLAPDEQPGLEDAQRVAHSFAGRAWIAAELLSGPDDRAWLDALLDLGSAAKLPLVAAGDVHMHVRSRRPLQDTLTAIRLRATVAAARGALYPNAERHLRMRMRLAQLYPPALLAETVRIAERCTFSLDSLRYEYPEELAPPGHTPASYLREITAEGLRARFPAGVPAGVRELIEHELALVAELGYEPYFLTVYDIVKFARGRGILCQGRGSAANSAVCYALGITEVDPARMSMLFERFISRERNEPPDIDVDFEHQRREEVIQYLYGKYGRDRAALAATVITYRTKSTLRDVAKALGFDLPQVDRLARSFAWWDGRDSVLQRLAEAGFDPASAQIQRLVALVAMLAGFPRHLSQHTGGFVFARGLLSRLVPIENAAMPERSVIQWDKDDLDALGLLKVDVLALGMLSAIRRALDMIAGWRGRPFGMADVPPEDPVVYEMIQHADTVGVFQIESRAQMSMLPRLKPRNFYDLVIEVAIVRPGPIQGGMVHPYLRRRQGLEPVTYPSAAVKAVLERTLGVPIFQEQVMQLAIVAAGFTPGESDRLRRSMAAWRRKGGLEHFEQRLVSGMLARGYQREFAERIYQQILGFGEYGFPECVVGETRVVDADTGRWRTIDEILASGPPLRHTLACGDDLHLRKRKVLGIAPSGVKPVFRLQTALGHTVTASAEHPFLTVNGWRELGSLRAGDYIAAARSLPPGGRRRWPRHRIIVLADLIAEGNLCHPSTFYFYTAQPRYRDEFARAVERFPNTRAVVERHKSCFSIRVRRIDRRRLSEAVMWLQELGIWDCGAREKFLPREVFELRDSDIALLLARLWEGDGGFSKAGHASYDTACRRLAEDVQHLLLRLGIVARLYRRVRSYRNRRIEHFVVTVTGEEPLQQFYRRIARRFLDPGKRRFAKSLAMQRARGRMSRDIIPVEVREIIRRERDALGLTWAEIGRRTGLSVREIQSRGKHKKGFRRFVIDRLAACLRSRELARLAGSDLYWDRVVVIEPAGRRESYDLRIQGNHNFLANNLVVHNSHSASFALLVYVSSWIKRHEPAAFLAALLNSQPMGFYAPSQLVQDARRHGVQVLPVDVTASSWDCVLEKNEELNRRDAEKNQDKMNRQDAKRNENQNGPEGNDSSSLIPHPSSLAASAPAVRLGLRMISGFAERAAGRIVTARNEHAFGSVEDLARRARLNRRDLKLLASAGALRSLSDHRRLAHWEVAGIERATPVLGDYPIDESLPQLAPPGEAEELVADYASLGLTLGRHPLALLRPRLARMRLATAAELRGYAHGRPARAAGIVVGRQRPDTASGVIFVTLEDETGSVNVIVWRDLADRQRRELLGSRLMEVYGTLEREGEVVHLIAQRLVDHSQLLGALETSSRDFH